MRTNTRFTNDRQIPSDVVMNDQIRYPEVRVIDSAGEQLGIMPAAVARTKARELSLDLILIAPQAQPPVVKIIDYGKWKYEKDKRQHEEAKKRRAADLKEVKMCPNIDDHDFNTKLNSVVRFITAGDKVKLTITFKGRQIIHQEFGEARANAIVAAVEAIGGTVEKAPVLEGRQMIMILSPKSAK